MQQSFRCLLAKRLLLIMAITAPAVLIKVAHSASLLVTVVVAVYSGMAEIAEVMVTIDIAHAARRHTVTTNKTIMGNGVSSAILTDSHIIVADVVTNT